MKRSQLVMLFWFGLLAPAVTACQSSSSVTTLPQTDQETSEDSVTVTRRAIATEAGTAEASVSPAAEAAEAIRPTPVVVTPEIVTPQITEEPTVEPTPLPPLSSADRPVQLLFPPLTGSAVIMRRAQPLIESLRAATGLEYVAGILDSEEALVRLLCSAPADTIGFVSAAAYTIAHDECGAEAGLVAVQEDGLAWQTGMIVTRPGAAHELADLQGQRWAYADTHSLPDYLFFRAKMVEAGIEPGEIIAAPEESSALLALRDGEADFATASFVPPIMPLGQSWVYGETEPEVWRTLGITPTRSPIGYVIVFGEPEFGGYRLRDARARLFDTTPDIFDVTRILMLSEPIPNESVIFGAELPTELVEQVQTAMTEFASSGTCQESLCSADFYGWTGLAPVEDAAYDPIRYIRTTLELETADLWAELD
jgi:ABC-type phosphate/phosphonate transport system substrate-binding protein